MGTNIYDYGSKHEHPNLTRRGFEDEGIVCNVIDSVYCDGPYGQRTPYAGNTAKDNGVKVTVFYKMPVPETAYDRPTRPEIPAEHSKHDSENLRSKKPVHQLPYTA